MQDTQRTLVDLAGVFASQFGERILTPGLRSRDQDVFWSFHPPPRFVLVNTFTATRGQSGGPPASSKWGRPKESKAGRPVLLRNLEYRNPNAWQSGRPWHLATGA